MSHTSEKDISRETSTLGTWLILAVLFLVAFFSYTWANQFPYFYHSDEESKALQLLYGYRNYWHPMLMLNATKTISWMLGADHDAQSITMVGRYLAAIFSSVGVVCFVLFAKRRQGLFTAILTGILLLTLPLLFEVSHYCKEDPALFMGLSIVLLALDMFLRKSTTQRLLFLGFATGLATSAKYPGALLIIGMLPVIFWRFRKSGPVLLFLMSASITILTINWQWIAHFQELTAGIQRESSMLVNGHDGVASQFPHAAFLRILLNQHGWPIILIAGLAILLTMRREARPNVESMLGFACLITLVFISFSAKVSDRYLLPIMAIILYLSACGVKILGDFVSLNYRPLFLGTIIGFMLWHPGTMLSLWITDFRSDSREEMAQWISNHLNKNDKLATSLWTRLPGIYPGQFISGVAPVDYVADLGSLPELQDMGYSWIAVADVESGHFTHSMQTGDAQFEAAYQRRREFYSSLQKEGILQWSSPPGVIYNLHPGLKLYQLHPGKLPATTL